MAMTSQGAVETSGRDGGGSAGRGDRIVGYFAAPARVCSGLRTDTRSMGLFFGFRTHFVPISPRLTKGRKARKSNWALPLPRLPRKRALSQTMKTRTRSAGVARRAQRRHITTRTRVVTAVSIVE